MSSLDANVRNRQWLLGRLRAEIVGPDPPDPSRALVIDPGEPILFSSWSEFNLPKIQPDGEEILWQDPPLKRYGAGILFPAGVSAEMHLAHDSESVAEEEPVDPVEPARDGSGTEILSPDSASPDVDDLGDYLDYEVGLANSHRPSSLAISFLADLGIERTGVRIDVAFAVYERREAVIRPEPTTTKGNGGLEGGPPDDFRRDLWFRQPGCDPRGRPPSVTVSTEDLLRTSSPIRVLIPGHEASGLRLVILSRPIGADMRRLLTVCLHNGAPPTRRLDEACFFQCGLTIHGASGRPWILPYPGRPLDLMDVEEKVHELLYRDRQTFAIGHGCAADWSPPVRRGSREPLVTTVRSEILPSYETPAITPDIIDQDGTPIRVDMRKLAGLVPGDDGSGELARLVDAYRRWIDGLERRVPASAASGDPSGDIPEEFIEVARQLIRRCRDCEHRIRSGIRYLEQDENARMAFRLANQAMLLAQLRSTRERRSCHWDDATSRYVFDLPTPEPDLTAPDDRRGYWRAFQIAFLLMSLPGVCDSRHPDRKTVDLIWFPTGGGKTEAYLGLTAFTLLYNRITGRTGPGSTVLMRYTLRLLTAQQFQRAGLLMCALEFLRRQRTEVLGSRPFRLGMWVGGDATPNTRAAARKALRTLQDDPRAENPFILRKCPWCAAALGPSGSGGEPRRRRGRRDQATREEVLGYETGRLPGSACGNTVIFRCPDPGCEFHRFALPITVIDEDIYEDPPDLLIGTVDKFALLTWKPIVRRIFGLGEDGERVAPPPTLIIQDELHLISGPLGSMVGAYELVIDELCTERRQDEDGQVIEIPPKIIASTATITRAEEQIRALYARKSTRLFPPSGIDANDSFFAREAVDASGKRRPGRLYLGVMAPAHGSQQTTQARLFAALLQYVPLLPGSDDDPSLRDPWWTLLCFFNSLRELGSAATLLLADTRDYLRVILQRHGHDYSCIRPLYNIRELTSRIRSDRVPRAIEELEVPYPPPEGSGSREPIDACLASSIIEVGIDIDRLALMTIVGQPKTVSQHIQVSSRVGRRPDAPGLVIVIYSQGKPRDRSHYESFRSFHESLYSQVEPTSVTPFSPPAADRVLHAVLVALVRQSHPIKQATNPRPCPLSPGSEEERRVKELIERRIRVVDPAEQRYVTELLARRLKEWRMWNPSQYGDFGSLPEDPPLLHPAGSHIPDRWDGQSWPTPTSLRHVDATCAAALTRHYSRADDREIQE